MDAKAFDDLSKDVARRSTRRAALGAALAGGLLGALGVAKSVPDVKAAQGGSCTLAFSANVRLGPSLGQPLSAQGQPGALQGNLSFDLDQSGRLVNGELQAASGERFPVVGQATGYSLQARIQLAPRVALVVVGVGEQEVAACSGAIDGMLSGPQSGDLGDWRATVSGASGGRLGGGQSSGDSPAQGGRADRGGGGGGTQAGVTGGRAPAALAVCSSGEVSCEAEGGGSFCANLATNISNCGECGYRCDGNLEFCQGGRCVSKASVTPKTCPPGEVFCFAEEGYCADLQTNVLNCGECGSICPTNAPVCSGGRCVEGRQDENGCGESLLLCDGQCVDVTSDPDNCGACGTLCPVSPEIYDCVDGVCVPPSCDPLVNCGGLCVDPLTDPLHCGTCGVACEEGATCQNGECQVAGGGGCLEGLIPCLGVCIDPRTDPANCGGCGVFCTVGDICEFGTCTAQAPVLVNCADQGLIECFGACVDLQSDPANCGFCGTLCASGQCAAGTCIDAVGPAPVEVGCPVGQADCGGGCIDVLGDPANCGFCGNVCSADQQCFLGGCIGGIDIIG